MKENIVAFQKLLKFWGLQVQIFLEVVKQI